MSCQAMILWESNLQLFHLRQAVLPAYSIDIAARLVGRRRSHCAKYQRATSIKCLAPLRRTKGVFSSRVMQWVCSLRDSLQGLDELTLPIRPTNRLPTSPLGAGHKATGRLHCYICNFLRVAQATLQCKPRNQLVFRVVSRLPENSNRTRIPQPETAVERSRFLWETPFYAHGIRVKFKGISLRNEQNRPACAFSSTSKSLTVSK